MAQQALVSNRPRQSAATAAKASATSHTVTQDEWRAIEADTEFRTLVAAKRSFIIPASIFFIIYYFALPILVGYFPQVMETNIVGNINLAYLFALSQFFMAWIIMAMYVKRARVFDEMSAKVVAKVKGGMQE